MSKLKNVTPLKVIEARRGAENGLWAGHQELTMKFSIIFRLEKLMKMSYNIWSFPREGFCWLNENKTVVISTDSKTNNGHCELLDTVSRLWKTWGDSDRLVSNPISGRSFDFSNLFLIAKKWSKLTKIVKNGVWKLIWYFWYSENSEFLWAQTYWMGSESALESFHPTL